MRGGGACDSDVAVQPARLRPASIGSIHYDDRHQPAIVRLLPMRGAAIAEEAAFVGVGVEAKILEASDPRARGALGNIGVKVEHRVGRPAAWDEVARRVIVAGGEGGDELGPHLVGSPADAGSE